jgi:hypothetical protein
MGRQALTNEQFINRVKALWEDKIWPLETYKPGRHPRLSFQCECGHQWLAWADRVISKISPLGCPICAKKRRRTGRFTDEQYRLKLEKAHGGDISLIGPYNGGRQQSEFLCRICGHQWFAQSSSLISSRKRGCPSPFCFNLKNNAAKKAISEKRRLTLIAEGKDKLKTCTKCLKEKEIRFFGDRKGGWFGKSSICRECETAYATERLRKISEKKKQESLSKKADVFGVTIEEFSGWKGVKKICPVCNLVKPLDDFGVCAYYKDGRSHTCKSCIKSRNAELESLLTDQERQERRDRRNAGKRRRKKAKKEGSFRKRTPQTLLQYRIAQNLRYRIRHTIKGSYISQTAISLIGCSIDDCKKHLESQFKRGMNWENYGKFWEIDHILPCASFDLTKESDQKICFHYTNLQPLKRKKNRSKGCKILNPQMSLLL